MSCRLQQLVSHSKQGHHPSLSELMHFSALCHFLSFDPSLVPSSFFLLLLIALLFVLIFFLWFSAIRTVKSFTQSGSWIKQPVFHFPAGAVQNIPAIFTPTDTHMHIDMHILYYAFLYSLPRRDGQPCSVSWVLITCVCVVKTTESQLDRLNRVEIRRRGFTRWWNSNSKQSARAFVYLLVIWSNDTSLWVPQAVWMEVYEMWCEEKINKEHAHWLINGKSQMFWQWFCVCMCVSVCPQMYLSAV